MAWYNYAKFVPFNPLVSSYYQGRALYRGWQASKNGGSYGDWNRYYTIGSALPGVSRLFDAYNSVLEANKRQINLGVGIDDIANPAISQEGYAGSAVQGALNQMVGFTSTLDRIYGNPDAVDRTRRSPHPPRSGYRPRHYHAGFNRTAARAENRRNKMRKYGWN